MREIASAGRERLRRRTVVHWVAAVLLTLSAIVAGISGIYFLFAPSGGFQGGRNAAYGAVYLFSRETWTDIHTWSGTVMIAIVVVHLALHWNWVAEMARRTAAVVRGTRKGFSFQVWKRVIIIAVIALVFVGTAVSGLYFLSSSGGHARLSQAGGFLISRQSWDLVHIWTGILLIVASVVHLVMRWKWIARVTPTVGRAMANRRKADVRGIAMQRTAG
jgi:hypothetical protein